MREAASWLVVTRVWLASVDAFRAYPLDRGSRPAA